MTRGRPGRAAALAAVPLLVGAITAGAATQGDAGAGSRPDQGVAQPVGKQAGTKTDTAAVYVPPDVGAPVTRVAAGTRGGAGQAPAVLVLAPPQTGLTSSASPVLYWYVSGPFSGSVEITLSADDEPAPLLDLRLEHGATAGVHALRLAEHRVALKPGLEYRWSVALTGDQQGASVDTYASGTIRRADRAGLPGDAAGLARAGYWYDALDAASQPALRASLLEQVGLRDAVAWDRGR